MSSWWQHPIDLIDLILIISGEHQVWLKLINLKMQVNGLVNVVVGIVITFARLIGEVMLTPAFTDPAIGAVLQLEHPRVLDLATS